MEEKHMNNLINTTSYEFMNALRRKKTNNIISTVNEVILVPEDFEKEFYAEMEKNSFFRKYGTVFKAPKFEGVINTLTSTAIAEWIDENTLYPEISDDHSNMGVKSHKLAALVKLKNMFVDDTKFDIQKYFCREFARAFCRAEEKAFISGNGVNEPKGIITEDANVTTETEGEITTDDIIRLFFSLEAEYRKNGVFIVNDDTALKLRMLKDKSGRYIWDENHDTIFGKPVLISAYMPDAESGNKAVAFGDLSYYWIVERQPLAIKILTEKFAREDATGYAGSERLDGKLIREDAIKLLGVK